MFRANRRALCVGLCAVLLTHPGLPTSAQTRSNISTRNSNGEAAKAPQLPEINARDLRLVLPAFHFDLLHPPLILTTDMTTILQNAIEKRLGVRYRYHGVDDHGYDCSGFVWSVFRETGVDFERGPARTLWLQLPEAKGSETSQFGTLVFFNGQKHIGIVRDGDSFYHASRSKGVKLSRFSGYWKKRITGYRRASMSIFPLPPDLI